MLIWYWYQKRKHTGLIPSFRYHVWIEVNTHYSYWCLFDFEYGRVAQMVERTVSIREVGGSMPPMSISFSFSYPFLTYFFLPFCLSCFFFYSQKKVVCLNSFCCADLLFSFRLPGQLTPPDRRNRFKKYLYARRFARGVAHVSWSTCLTWRCIGSFWIDLPYRQKMSKNIS